MSPAARQYFHLSSPVDLPISAALEFPSCREQGCLSDSGGRRERWGGPGEGARPSGKLEPGAGGRAWRLGALAGQQQVQMLSLFPAAFSS